MWRIGERGQAGWAHKFFVDEIWVLVACVVVMLVVVCVVVMVVECVLLRWWWFEFWWRVCYVTWFCAIPVSWWWWCYFFHIDFGIGLHRWWYCETVAVELFRLHYDFLCLFCIFFSMRVVFCWCLCFAVLRHTVLRHVCVMMMAVLFFSHWIC